MAKKKKDDSDERVLGPGAYGDVDDPGTTPAVVQPGIEDSEEKFGDLPKDVPPEHDELKKEK